MKTRQSIPTPITRKNFKTFLMLLVFGSFILCLLAIRVDAQTFAMVNNSKREVSELSSNELLTTCLVKAKEAVAGNDVHEAIRLFTLALTEGKNQASIYDSRGCAYARLHQYKNAIQDFARAIALDSMQAEFFYHKGLAENKAGKYQTSYQDCSQAIKRNNSFSEAYLVRGLSTALGGDSKSSMQDFQESIKYNPGYAEAYYNIGLNYYEAGENTLARKYFKEAKLLGFENPELKNFMNEK